MKKLSQLICLILCMSILSSAVTAVDSNAVAQDFYMNNSMVVVDDELLGAEDYGEAGVRVWFAADSELEECYRSIDEIPAGSTVYYHISCKFEYSIKWIHVNTHTADTESFVMPDGDLTFIIERPLVGDTNDDGAVNISDALFLLKYIAGWEEICEEVSNSGCGDAYLDFRRDTVINIVDCMFMLKYIAGTPIELPTPLPPARDFGVNHID